MQSATSLTEEQRAEFFEAFQLFDRVRRDVTAPTPDYAHARSVRSTLVACYARTRTCTHSRTRVHTRAGRSHTLTLSGI